ncbi:MAG: putative toxin-antitoxin system toxin component, PIN family [Thiotrichaceae bacterium IS1]|nr:MAG: putative toxin-antitoxin system toxin component, PIN family [Thiotrichaceae bacterium IS1]
MKPFQIVIDTNVLITAAKSNLGASYKLFSLVDSGKFELNISVPLLFEYEEVLRRTQPQTGLSDSDITDLLDYLCQIARPHKISYLWRPFLTDADDDFILELAIQSQSDYIINYNKKDFKNVEWFGITVLTSKEFLQLIGECS